MCRILYDFTIVRGSVMGNLTANEKQSVLNVPKKVIQTLSAKTHLIVQTVRATIVHIRSNVWNG